MKKIKKITCPTCRKASSLTPENKFRPFCCERCKLIDLGAWAAEEHRVPGEPANTPELPDDDEV